MKTTAILLTELFVTIAASRVVWTATRMKSHHNSKCKIYNDQFRAGNSMMSRNENIGGAALTSSSKQSSIKTFTDKLDWSAEKMAELEFALAYAVILKGYPFDTLGGPEFEKAFKFLSVNFQPASSEVVSEKYLSKLYEDVQVRILTHIARHARAIVITSDGWSNRKRQSIHNVMICIPQPFYYGQHI